MSQNQREAWERVQLMLQKRKGNFGGFPGGGGRGGMGFAGTLIILGVGAWAVSNSLFNGMKDLHLSVASCLQAI
jgi:prohibitin 2